MVPGRVSVILPSRGERWLGQTIDSLLAWSEGDIEIVAVLDGYWPDPPLTDDPRVRILHHGQAKGMRPGINAGVAMSTGEFVLKLDAHCLVAQGFDVDLKADCADDWVVVPRRYPLDAERWCIQDNCRCGHDVEDHAFTRTIDAPEHFCPDPRAYCVACDCREFRNKIPIDYHYLSYPYETNAPSCGLHGTPWRARSKGREHLVIDDEMSSQGSCYFLRRMFWDRLIGPLEIDKYGNFIQEFQEVGLKAWLSGGAVKVNKGTWYAHLHKGKTYGRGYFISKAEGIKGRDFARDYWMRDQWPHQTRSLRSLIEQFSPVPTWPEDLDAAFDPAHWGRRRRVFVTEAPSPLRSLMSDDLADALSVGRVPPSRPTPDAVRDVSRTEDTFEIADPVPARPVGEEPTTPAMPDDELQRHLSRTGRQRVHLPPAPTAPMTETELFLHQQLNPGSLPSPVDLPRGKFDRKKLYKLFSKLGYTKGAEIGVADGRNALAMCQRIPNLRLLGVDPWKRYRENPRGGPQEQHDGNRDKALARLSDYNAVLVDHIQADALGVATGGSDWLSPFGDTHPKQYHVALWQLTSMEAIHLVEPGSLDFVYIDGHHGFDYVMRDIVEWGRRVRVGGIIAGHDYYPFQWAGVVEAVNAYVAAHHVREWFLTREREPTWFFCKTAEAFPHRGW